MDRTALAGTGLATNVKRDRAGDPGSLADISRAIERRELELHYQPIIDVQGAAIRGAEGLIRWRRGEELVPPGAFLPAVERCDLIGPLTRLVLDLALARLAAWERDGLDLSVSVNLSGRNLMDPALSRDLAQALARHGAPAERVVLEVTETVVLDDHEAAAAMLRELTALGVEVSLDDFGIGDSSLLRLDRFPISEVKVDRSFVRDAARSDRPILAATIEFLRTLGMRTVGEGVEDVSALNVLRAVGCDLAQGYLFSPALPPGEFEDWRRRHGAQTTSIDILRVLLDAMREELGIDVAFISEFQSGWQVPQIVSGGEAQPVSLEESYCARVVAGVLPNIIPGAVRPPHEGAGSDPAGERRRLHLDASLPDRREPVRHALRPERHRAERPGRHPPEPPRGLRCQDRPAPRAREPRGIGEERAAAR